MEIRVSDDLWPVRIDPAALEHVLVNLAANARDALASGGGKVCIQARRGETADGQDHAVLTFSDDGPGMDEATQSRCFEPFFTTRSPGVGTGLGLASCHGVITQAGGTIDVESALGEGTRFTISLPRSTDVSVDPARPKTAAMGGNGETILVVEDEAPLRRIISRELRASGYQVLSAANGRDALTLVDRDNWPDLLLTDVIMPEMNGPALAERLLQDAPHMPVLFMSGYAGHVGLRSSVWEGREHRFLEKPFTMEELLVALRAALS